MEVCNKNYFYGRKIIWNAYRAILRRERQKHRENKELLERLGQKLLGECEVNFSEFEFMDVFNRLPKADRKLLKLRYWEDFSIEELANYYGVHGTRISHRLSDSREKFRRLWRQSNEC